MIAAPPYRPTLLAMIRYFFLTFLLFLPLTACADQEEEEARTEKVFNAEHFMLENGLEIIVVPNHRAPVVTHMIWYKTGAADEPRGKSGIAHFLEHLMFKGSEGLNPGEFSERVRAMGGNDNAFTSQDYTSYFQSIAVEHLGEVMKMEAGRMRGLNPPQKEFDSEHLVIQEERRQRTDNRPEARFGEQLNYALYPNHPYGIPIIGWLHEIEYLTWNDAKTFYDHHYGPNNAILVVSGDVTGKQVLDLAKEYYGPLKPIDIPPRTRTTIPPLPADQIIRMRDKTVREPQLQIMLRLPSFAQNREEALALQVLEEIMGAGATSRLYKSLVVEQKLATSTGFGYSGNALNDSYGWIYATPQEGKTLEDLKAALDKGFLNVIQNGVTDKEVSEAITRLQDAAIYARDSLSGPAMVIGRSLTTGSTLDEVEYWPRDIGKVTPEQVKAVAAKYFNPNEVNDRPRVIGYLLPAENAS